MSWMLLFKAMTQGLDNDSDYLTPTPPPPRLHSQASQGAGPASGHTCPPCPCGRSWCCHHSPTAHGSSRPPPALQSHGPGLEEARPKGSIGYTHCLAYHHLCQITEGSIGYTHCLAYYNLYQITEGSIGYTHCLAHYNLYQITEGSIGYTLPCILWFGSDYWRKHQINSLSLGLLWHAVCSCQSSGLQLPILYHLYTLRVRIWSRLLKEVWQKLSHSLLSSTKLSWSIIKGKKDFMWTSHKDLQNHNSCRWWTDRPLDT